MPKKRRMKSRMPRKMARVMMLVVESLSARLVMWRVALIWVDNGELVVVDLV